MTLAPELAPLARSIWRRLEPYHAITYFAAESRTALDAVGMKGFWMGYFASRSAAMGPVSPKMIVATFYNFHASLVKRAVPDCWKITTPAAVLHARVDGMVDALSAMKTLDVEQLKTLAPLAKTLAEAATTDLGGRPLFAAHAGLQWPDGGAPITAWWAATLIREHRGDGHIAALVDAGIGPCEALVMQSTYTAIPRETLQRTRNWPDVEWDAALDALASRGLVAGDGAPTDKGRAYLQAIEARTDELATRPLAIMGEEAARALAEAALPVAHAVMASGVVPSITPMFADDDEL
ncbi:MAG: hypothetical protein QOJ00_2635 [Actinomycetota bacterium]